MGTISEFATKFMDIMIGIVLGLGFQWWPNLNEHWQYIAFVFVYLSAIDYWIDTANALKKYPPKRELDVMLDVAIMFLWFLFIYSTQQTILYFLILFVILRIFDTAWTFRVIREYQPTTNDRTVFHTWIKANIIEIFLTLILLGLSNLLTFTALTTLLIFIGFRLAIRVFSSSKYKRIYFA